MTQGMALFQTILALVLFLGSGASVVYDVANGNTADGFYFKLFICIGFLIATIFFAVIWHKIKRSARNIR